MKNLKNFQSNEDYTYFIDGGAGQQPNVSLVRSPKKVYYKKINENPYNAYDDFLTLEATEDNTTLSIIDNAYNGTANLSGTYVQLYYKINDSDGVSLNIHSGETVDTVKRVTNISLSAGDTIQLYSMNGTITYEWYLATSDTYKYGEHILQLLPDKKLYVYGNLSSLLTGNYFKDIHANLYNFGGQYSNTSYKRGKSQLFYIQDTYRQTDLSLFNTSSSNNVVNHPYKPLVYNGPESDLTFIEYPNLTIETNFQEKLWPTGDISSYTGTGKLILTRCSIASDTKGNYIEYVFNVSDGSGLTSTNYNSFAIGNNIFDVGSTQSGSDEIRITGDNYYLDAENYLEFRLYNGYSLDLGEDKEITFKTLKTL